jgi:hypothetical protein
MVATTAEKVSRPRPKLDEKELRAAEKVLKAKYPDIVKDTLKNAEAGTGPHANKRTVEIKCAHKGCNVTRRVATSDLAQVTMCEEHTRQARLERRREARKVRAAAKPKKAKKKATPKTTATAKAKDKAKDKKKAARPKPK